MAWQGIEGHDEIAGAFIRAAARGRVSGSYLFVGPPGVGKTTFALQLARALACHDLGPDLAACGRCASCRQAAAGSHPDIDVVRKPDDRSTIPLETFIGDAAHRMREGLCWRILLKPAVAVRRTALILDADHLAVEGANCLLKTLEEPPANAVIILVGTALERQLPTIRSRCQIIRFRSLATAAVERILAAKQQRGGAEEGEPAADRAAIAAAAAASGGSLTRARLLLEPELAAFRARLVDLLGQPPLRGVVLARETTALVEAAGKEASPRRARLRLVLEAALDFHRAALRLAAAGETPADPALTRIFGAASPDADAAVISLRTTLATLAAIDRNANLTVLVEGWTALLEAPRLRSADSAFCRSF
jgi:DNA polymerase-3 subunit delta'